MSRPEYPRSIPNFWPHCRPTFKKRFWLSKGLSNRDKLLKPTLRPQLILVNSCKPCQVKFPAITLNFSLSLLLLNVLTKKIGSIFKCDELASRTSKDLVFLPSCLEAKSLQKPKSWQTDQYQCKQRIPPEKILLKNPPKNLSSKEILQKNPPDKSPKKILQKSSKNPKSSQKISKQFLKIFWK